MCWEHPLAPHFTRTAGRVSGVPLRLGCSCACCCCRRWTNSAMRALAAESSWCSTLQVQRGQGQGQQKR